MVDYLGARAVCCIVHFGEFVVYRRDESNCVTRLLNKSIALAVVAFDQRICVTGVVIGIASVLSDCNFASVGYG